MIHVVCSQCKSKFVDVHFTEPERFDIRCPECAAQITNETWQAVIEDDWTEWCDEEHTGWIEQQEIPIATIGANEIEGASAKEKCWFCKLQKPDDKKPGRLTLLFTKTLLDAQRAPSVPPPHVQVSANISLSRCADCATKQNRATTIASIAGFLFALPGLLLLGNFVMQYFVNKDVSDATLYAGLGGIALIGIGVGVFQIVIKAAHNRLPSLKDHPIPMRAQALGWDVSTSESGLTKW